MRCPFLREAQVKSCQASAYRKMIIRSAVPAGNERCLSPEYVHCPAAKQFHEELPSRSRCPFLQESLVQYCSAAPVTKYIPYTESILSKCGGERHHYCELFLGMARPAGKSACPRSEEVDGIPVPERLYFSRNHFWLDLNDDGSFLIGIDGLLARVLGPITNVTFLPFRGSARPSVVFTVNGMDLQVVFPNPAAVSGVNAYLRANPERITADPYGLGWLFEGSDAGAAERANAPLFQGLSRGAEARRWMHDDLQRISVFIHERTSRPDDGGTRILNDGGLIGPDVIRHLSHEEVLHLFNEFFSPYASPRR